MPQNKYYSKRPMQRNTSKYSRSKSTVDKRQDRKINDLSRKLKNELKFIKTSSSFTPTATFTVELLSGVATGDTIITREANAIIGATFLLNYQVRFAIGSAQWDPANDQDQYMRVIVFRDRDPNGVMPTMVEAGTGFGVLDDLANTDLKIRNSLSLKSGRFKIMHDKIHIFSPDSTQNNEVIRYQKLKFKIKNKIQYSLSTDAIGACAKNHYFVAAVIGAAGATNQPAFVYNSQVRFWDP